MKAQIVPDSRGSSPGMTVVIGRSATDSFLYDVSLRHRLFDQFVGGFRQQLVARFAIN